MSHFAQVDSNNMVIKVIVAEQDFINSGAVGDPASWIQTSYNTRGGTHILGGTPLRKNYAGVGYTYDPELDAFIPPKPAEDWIFYPEICLWGPPGVPYPSNLSGNYYWNQNEQSWQLITTST